MRNPNIARILRYYKKLYNLSVKDVRNYLYSKDIDVAIKTIYGWESGNTQPSADTLMTLCAFYRIENILETFGYSENTEIDIPIMLSEEEKVIIESYRRMPAMQNAVKKLLEIR